MTFSAFLFSAANMKWRPVGDDRSTALTVNADSHKTDPRRAELASPRPGRPWPSPRRSCPTSWASFRRRHAPTPSRASPPTSTITSARRSTSGWVRCWSCSSSSRTCCPAPRSGSPPSTCCGRCTAPSRWPPTRSPPCSHTSWTRRPPGRSRRRCSPVGHSPAPAIDAVVPRCRSRSRVRDMRFPDGRWLARLHAPKRLQVYSLIYSTSGQYLPNPMLYFLLHWASW